MTTSNMPGKFEHVVETIVGGSVSVALVMIGIVTMGLVVYSLFAG
jgi:hypothetical protein